MALNKRKVLEAARKHAQKGAKAKALKEYNKLLKGDPRDAKLMLEVGDAYRRWGQSEEAIAQYVKVAQQYRLEGFDARAVAVYKQILHLDPKNYCAYVTLSELYQRMGLDSEAVAALQTAADGYHGEGRRTDALELLRQMAALDPTNTTSRLKVAELLRQEGLEGEAVSEYEAVVDELENHRDRDQLVTVLERILEVRPDHIGALTSLVRELVGVHEFERAESLAVRALDLSPDVPQYELVMDLYSQMGDEGKLSDATRGLAKLHRDRGDEERARELTQRLPVDEVGLSHPVDAVVSEVDGPEVRDEGGPDEDEPFLSVEEEGLSDAGADDASWAPGRETPLVEGAGSFDVSASDCAASEAASARLPVENPDQLMAEASVYLRYGKAEEAVASLRGILAQEPSHRAALEKLGEAYADLDRGAEATAVWMQAAGQMSEAGESEALSALRDRIAALDPVMAAGIGESCETEAAPEEDEALLMEIDLEICSDLEIEVGSEEVAEGETRSELDVASGAGEAEIDEESMAFDMRPVEWAPDGATPTAPPEIQSGPTVEDDHAFEFEIDPDELSFAFAVAAAESDDDVSVEPDFDAGEWIQPPPATGVSQSTPDMAWIDEGLEEAEFYLAQGLYDEAEGLLERVLYAVPDHPTALLRRGEVQAAREGEPDWAIVERSEPIPMASEVPADEQAGVVAASADEACVSEPTESAEDDLPEPRETQPVETFDLREALADVLADDEDPAALGALGASKVGDGFESIFSDFKKGVSATLDRGDYDTRYDLGIAYREMGLYEDAIGEFTVCLDSPARRFDSLYLMGLCARDLGRFDVAVGHLEQALALPDLAEERMAGVYFDLSQAEEGAGDRDRACASIRRVLELDPGFPGAAERLTALDPGDPTPPELAKPIETFESFDDVVSEVEAELGDAEFVVGGAPRPTQTQDDRDQNKPNPAGSRRSGRKKISFV